MALKGFTRSFYQEGGDHRLAALTRNNFAATGIVATEEIIEGVLPTTAAFQEKGRQGLLDGVLIVPIARTGFAVFPKATLGRWQEKLPGVPVWPALIGASRHNNPEESTATIYTETLSNLPKKSWEKWVVVIFEYGLATASTLEAVLPLIRQELPEVRNGNIIIFANCACIHQAKARLDKVSKETILTYGSRWSYDPLTFYLTTMINPDGTWWPVTPQDWGERAFGTDIESFISEMRAYFPEPLFTDKNAGEIRTHFAREKRR